VKLSIAPKQVMALDDVVSSPMRTSGVGQLEFLGDTVSLNITSRTYTRANGGTYGQFIPALSTFAATTLADVPQLQSTADFRTNAGFAEVNGSSGTVRVTLFDAATGAVLSQQDYPVVPFGQVQFPVAGAALMTAELQVVDGDARIVAYGSVIDNHSGDPIYIASIVPQSGDFVAPVISQPGISTFWRSDVFLSAFGSSGGSFDLTYINAATGEQVTKHGSVAAHQAMRLDDIVGSYFGSPNTLGTVNAHLSPDLVATSRTFAISSDGTYGQFIPLIEHSCGDTGTLPSTRPAQLLHIERSASFRTNLGAINTGTADQVVRFTLYDAGGHAINSTERTIAPLRVTQFSLDALTSTPVIDARVEVLVISGWPIVAAWASVIDNVTGDPIFVPAQ
jgi:hypothetical protein